MGIKKKIKIFKLNANNYRTWATMMKINFDDKNLCKIINDDVKKSFANKLMNKKLWKQNNLIIKSYILINIEKKQIQHIIKLIMIKKQWNKFVKIHLNKNKTRFIFLINRLNIYKAAVDVNIDNVVFEIQKTTCTIIEIRKKLELKNFILVLILINAVNEKCYVMTKWQLKNMNNFIFIDVIEKYKEMKQKIHDNYTSLKIEIINKAINNKIDKKKNSTMIVIIAIKKTIAKTNVIND